MVRLCIKEVAQQRGLRLSRIQQEARLSMSTVRRYWYNSSSGRARDAGTLREVNLQILGAIATLLDVEPGELMQVDE